MVPTNLIGTDEMVRDRLRAYRDVGVNTLSASLRRQAAGIRGGTALPLHERIEALGHLMDLVNEVNKEPVKV